MFSNPMFAKNDEEDEKKHNVKIEQRSSFYYEAFSITLKTDRNRKIRYTLDGSNPISSKTALTVDNYTKIKIDPVNTNNRAKTPAVILRAIATPVKKNEVEVCRTFIFMEELLYQNNPKGKWPQSNINGQVIDYEMDKEVVESIEYEDFIEDAFMDIPTLSIITDMHNLFDKSKGIYVNPSKRGEEWERESIIELINPDDEEGFMINCGLRIRGGYSRHTANPKHSFRFNFKDEYGYGKLKYPLFGDEGTDEFNKLDLRTAQNYSWSFNYHPGKHNLMIRDEFSRHTQRDMGNIYTRSKYCHLFLNGMYWGVYQFQERVDDEFCEAYIGGDDDDFDVIKVDGSHINNVEGKIEDWEKVWELIKNDLSIDKNYKKIIGGTAEFKKSYIDVDNLIDYMILIFFTGNFDGPTSKFSSNLSVRNFYMLGDRKNMFSGYKFLVHDAEHSLLYDAIKPGIGIEENRVNIGKEGVYRQMKVSKFALFHPQWLHHKLCANIEYRQRFADRVYKAMFNNGALTVKNCQMRALESAKKIEMAIIAESARWGDSKMKIPRTRDDDWLPELEKLITKYFPERHPIVVEQLIEENLFSDILPPEFYFEMFEIKQDEVNVIGECEVIIGKENDYTDVYYTTNGEDPRLEGGKLNENSKTFEFEKILTIDKNTVIMARSKEGTRWSPLRKLIINKKNNIENLKFTEVNYHPIAYKDVDDDEFEFIEIKNNSSKFISLSNYKFTDGIEYTFPKGTILRGGEYIVLAKNEQEFYNRYGIRPFGEYLGKLSNSGELIELANNFTKRSIEFEYSDKGNWPEACDGEGYTLVAKDLSKNYKPNSPEYWAVSAEINGSPFKKDASIVNDEIPVYEIEVATIYPNPVKNSEILYIEVGYENYNVAIHNSVGKLMFKGHNVKEIDINNNFNTGVYYLIIEKNGIIKSKEKFVVR
jgi:hypothetical protein